MKGKLIAVIILILALTGAFLLFNGRGVRIDASQCLHRAYSGQNTATYEGSVESTVFLQGRKIETQSRIYHQRDIERVDYSLSPSNRAIVVTTAGETKTYSPAHKLLTITKSASPSGLDRLAVILKSYDITARTNGQVAGRTVDLLEFTPKTDGNPSKKLWVDHDTGVILKSESISSSGKLISRMEFTNISYVKSIRDDVFNRPVAVDAKWTTKEESRGLTTASAEKILGKPLVLPAYLPNGYALDSISLHPCGCCCKLDSVHLRYANGLNSLSIFETPTAQACRGGNCTIHCPKNGGCKVEDTSQARIATTSVGSLNIVLVADISENELRRVAQSLK